MGKDGKSVEASLGQVIFYVVIIWVAISILPFSFGALFPLVDWGFEQRGQLGDMFGFTNSFFSSLAFALLVFTVYLQRKDIALQRETLKAQKEELELSRIELKRTASAQEKSEEVLRRQHEAQLVAIKLTAIGSEIAQCDRAMETLHKDGNTASFDHVDKVRSNFFRQQKKLYGELGITSWDSEG